MGIFRYTKRDYAKDLSRWEALDRVRESRGFPVLPLPGSTYEEVLENRVVLGYVESGQAGSGAFE